MTKRTLATLALAATMLSACGMPNYLPTHGQSIDEAAGARLECKMISEGMTPSGGGGILAVSGRPAFVGAALGGYALGLAIGAAIQQQHKIELYDDCMVAHGYQKDPRG